MAIIPLKGNRKSDQKETIKSEIGLFKWPLPLGRATLFGSERKQKIGNRVIQMARIFEGRQNRIRKKSEDRISGYWNGLRWSIFGEGRRTNFDILLARGPDKFWYVIGAKVGQKWVQWEVGGTSARGHGQILIGFWSQSSPKIVWWVGWGCGPCSARGARRILISFWRQSMSKFVQWAEWELGGSSARGAGQILTGFQSRPKIVQGAGWEVAGSSARGTGQILVGFWSQNLSSGLGGWVERLQQGGSGKFLWMCHFVWFWTAPDVSPNLLARIEKQAGNNRWTQKRVTSPICG